MKPLMRRAALLLLAVVLPAAPASASGWLQHPSLTPSAMQGAMFTGAVHTNAGWSQKTLFPALYHIAGPNDPWWQPSLALPALGGSVGHGDAAIDAGLVIDAGPQFVYGLETVVGFVSPAAGHAVTGFFNCSAASTACGALSTGVLLNLTAEEDGVWSNTWHAWGRHPLGEMIGGSILFGGPGAVNARAAAKAARAAHGRRPEL